MSKGMPMWFDKIIQELEVNGKIPSKRSNYKFLRVKFKSDSYVLEVLDIYESQGYTVRELFTLAKLRLEEPGLCTVCQKSRRMFVFGDRGLQNYCQNKCSSGDLDRIQTAVKKRDADPELTKLRSLARKQTMLSKYGVEFNSQRADIKPILQKSKLQTRVVDLVTNRDWLFEQYITLDKTYQDISTEFEIDRGTIQKYIAIHEIPVKTGYSIQSGQRQVAQYIESLGFIVEQNARIFPTDKREIDILVKDRNFGIEYDGLYYHGQSCKLSATEKRIHQKKIIDAQAVDVFVIRITEEEWKESTELVKSIIRSKLGVTTKIHARNCKIRNVTAADARIYHIQIKSSIKSYINS